jgi:hypothetical protein
MSRAFSFNDSISYIEPIQERKNLKLKKYQAEKILEITAHSCYVNKYSDDLMKFFWIKIFYIFTSSLFRAILYDTYTNYFKNFMKDKGLEKKIKIKFGNIDETD